MIETKSLANPELLKNTSVVVADIDFTLVDFARAQRAAIESLIPQFGNDFSKLVNNIFMLINEEHQHKNS